MDLAPTLSKIDVGDSRTIILVEVVKYDRATHVVELKAVRALKGAMPADAIAHEVAASASDAVARARSCSGRRRGRGR